MRRCRVRESAAGVLVVHAGAMGDTAMIWPLLRALLRTPGVRCVRAAVSPAMVDLTRRLMAGRAEVGGGVDFAVEPSDASAYARLWVGDGEREGWEERIDRVLAFVVGGEDGVGADLAGAAWLRAARERFGDDVRPIGPPGSASRAALWASARVDELGAVRAVANADGPIVMHVGGGGAKKRWPMERFVRCVRAMEAERLGPVRVLAGHVELETFGAREREMFEDLGGRYVTNAMELAGELERARIVVAADTGPGHVAAQLGVRVVSLFGPTDPAVWSPRGASGCVRVLAPTRASAMTWLEVEPVLGAVREMLAAGEISGER